MDTSGDAPKNRGADYRDPYVPVIYHDPSCDPCRALHWFIEETGIHVYLRPTWMWRGDHRSPSFEKVNPKHMIPVMEHKLENGEVFILLESIAIMRYLCDLHGGKLLDQYFGETMFERARIEEYLLWHQANLRRSLVHEYVVPVIYRPFWLGTSVLKRLSDSEVSKRRAGFQEHFLQLDDVLQNNSYLVGGRLTAADLFISTTVNTVVTDPKFGEIAAQYPGLAQWSLRLRERPASATARAMLPLLTLAVQSHYAAKAEGPGQFHQFVDEWECHYQHIISHADAPVEQVTNPLSLGDEKSSSFSATSTGVQQPSAGNGTSTSSQSRFSSGESEHNRASSMSLTESLNSNSMDTGAATGPGALVGSSASVLAKILELGAQKRGPELGRDSSMLLGIPSLRDDSSESLRDDSSESGRDSSMRVDIPSLANSSESETTPSLPALRSGSESGRDSNVGGEIPSLRTAPHEP